MNSEDNFCEYEVRMTPRSRSLPKEGKKMWKKPKNGPKGKRTVAYFTKQLNKERRASLKPRREPGHKVNTGMIGADYDISTPRMESVLADQLCQEEWDDAMNREDEMIWEDEEYWNTLIWEIHEPQRASSWRPTSGRKPRNSLISNFNKDYELVRAQVGSLKYSSGSDFSDDSDDQIDWKKISSRQKKSLDRERKRNIEKYFGRRNFDGTLSNFTEDGEVVGYLRDTYGEAFCIALESVREGCYYCGRFGECPC